MAFVENQLSKTLSVFLCLYTTYGLHSYVNIYTKAFVYALIIAVRAKEIIIGDGLLMLSYRNTVLTFYFVVVSCRFLTA